MSISEVWVIPVAPSPGLVNATRGALVQLRLDHRVVRVVDVGGQLRREPPGAAIIQAARLEPMLLDVQRWLSQQEVPTLVLLEALDDRREALLLGRGAQDVIPVPASPTRLRGRILALHRRRRSDDQDREREQARPDPMIFVPPTLSIYPERRVVMVGDRLVHLTKSEFDLLVALARAPTDVLTREQLARALDRPTLSTRALESHVSRLRGALLGAGAPPFIQAVRGVGYRLAILDPGSPPSSASPSHPAH